jgi:molybdopterin-containing oxidoreductase family iron-sulfur binding subunit
MVACPYTSKVFNWHEPEWPDEFKTCLNPDVSLRMNGVVEKCSFCAHRLIIAKEETDLEGVDIRDIGYIPACAESCPADAIYFGDLKNRNSKVYKLSQSSRAYREMEGLGVEPKVIYLSARE